MSKLELFDVSAFLQLVVQHKFIIIGATAFELLLLCTLHTIMHMTHLSIKTSISKSQHKGTKDSNVYTVSGCVHREKEVGNPISVGVGFTNYIIISIQ